MVKSLATITVSKDDAFIIMEALHNMFKAHMKAKEIAVSKNFDATMHHKEAFTHARLAMELDMIIHAKKWCNDPECHYKTNVEDFRRLFKTELAEIAMQNNGNGK